MVDKVLINNIEKYELSFFKIAMQLRAINYLKEKNALTRWKEAERSQKREPEECSFRQTFVWRPCG